MTAYLFFMFLKKKFDFNSQHSSLQNVVKAQLLLTLMTLKAATFQHPHPHWHGHLHPNARSTTVRDFVAVFYYV